MEVAQVNIIRQAPFVMGLLLGHLNQSMHPLFRRGMTAQYGGIRNPRHRMKQTPQQTSMVPLQFIQRRCQPHRIASEGSGAPVGLILQAALECQLDQGTQVGGDDHEQDRSPGQGRLAQDQSREIDQQ